MWKKVVFLQAMLKNKPNILKKRLTPSPYVKNHSCPIINIMLNKYI